MQSQNQNQTFDCQQMPEDVKSLFFDSYRQPNNTSVTLYVAEERPLIKRWLLENGASEEDDVTVLYHWVDEIVTEKFTFDGESENDDDDDDDGEEAPVKIKNIKKIVEETNVVFDIPLDIPKEDILEFEDESETE